MKQRLKHWLGAAASAARAHRWLLGNRSPIALFYRVDDRLKGDALSCTSEEFDGWCGFLRRHFDVVPVSDLVARLREGTSVRGLAAITFDDGYADNFETAAPILEDHSLPACFFVVSEFIGSEHVAWWDEMLPVDLAWMDWNQVRSLRDRGFEIGCHTMTHADLGEVSEADAAREIEGGRLRLEKELGSPIRLFSYPYGGRQQLRAHGVELIRGTGFDCCLSAYGGLVQGGDDPFRVQRVPISPWFASTYQFLFEMLTEAQSGSPVRPHSLA